METRPVEDRLRALLGPGWHWTCDVVCAWWEVENRDVGCWTTISMLAVHAGTDGDGLRAIADAMNAVTARGRFVVEVTRTGPPGGYAYSARTRPAT